MFPVQSRTSLVVQAAVLICCSALIAAGLAVGPLIASGAGGPVAASTVDIEGRPITKFMGISHTTGGAADVSAVIYSVPGDKWLHITGISLGTKGPNALISAKLYSLTSGSTFHKYIPISARVFGKEYAYAANLDGVDIWVGPGSDVYGNYRIAGSPTVGSLPYGPGTLGFTGYLVPASSMP